MERICDEAEGWAVRGQWQKRVRAQTAKAQMTNVMKKFGRQVVVGLVAALLVGVVVEGPAVGQPMDGRGEGRGEGRGDGRGFGPGGFGPGGWGPGGPPAEGEFRLRREPLSEDEREAALAWAKTSMPKTHAYYDENLENNRIRAYLRGVMVQYYRRSRDTKSPTEFPELAALFERECKTMDSLIATARAYGRASEAEREKLRSTMRDQFRTVIVSRLNERQARIENLRSRLEKQERTLKAEQARIEATADRQLDELTGRVPMVDSAPPGGATTASEAPTTQPGEVKDGVVPAAP